MSATAITHREPPAAGTPIFVERTIEADGLDDDSRSVRFVASDESIDRYGDIVRSDWNLRAFKKNPVLLWNHSYGIPPIGTVEHVEVEGKKLIAVPRFAPPEVSEFADELYRLVRAKILRAVSVGFSVEPGNVERREDSEGNWTGGYIYHAPELLELSLVSVPANPKALATGRALGISANVLARVMPHTGVLEHQRKTFAAMLAARLRELRLYGPR